MWNAVDYLIKITGDVKENRLANGKETSLEIPYFSLRPNNADNKGDPLVIGIEVWAIGNITVVGKGGPFVKSMYSMLISLIANNLFLTKKGKVILYYN